MMYEATTTTEPTDEELQRMEDERLKRTIAESRRINALTPRERWREEQAARAQAKAAREAEIETIVRRVLAEERVR